MQLGTDPSTVVIDIEQWQMTEPPEPEHASNLNSFMGENRV